MASKKETTTVEVPSKDPTIALLIAIIGGFFLGFPGIGYIYLGNMKKGLIYGLIGWILIGAVLFGFLFGGTILAMVTMGFGMLCCIPFFLLIPVYNIAVAYDTYMDASGGKKILPEF